MFPFAGLSSRTKKITALLIGSAVYVISRLFFITPAPVFFDSGEYLARFQQSNYFSAIDSGHVPLHAGYIILFWPIYHLAQALHLAPITTFLIFQVGLSLIGIYFFWGIVWRITHDLRIATISAILVSLTPLFWITNGTVMIETTVVTFLLASTFCYLKYVEVLTTERYKQTLFWGLAGTSCFIFAFLTQPFVLLWLPFLWGVSLAKSWKAKLQLGGLLSLGFAISSAVVITLIAQEMHTSLIAGFHFLFLSKLGEQAQFSLTLQTALVYMRNFLIPLLRNNTPLLLFLSVIGFIQLLRQKSWLSLWCVLWIAPAFITNQWWDSLFAGRHALIASFGVSFLAASVLKYRPRWFGLTCIYLLVVSGYAMTLLHTPIPYLEEARLISHLPANGMVIESHYARPQTQGMYYGKMIFVDEPYWEQSTVVADIKTALAQSQPVFISGFALAEPYGFYTGPYLHTLGLSYQRPYDLKKMLEQFTLQRFKTVNAEDNVVMYRIVSVVPSPYPKIPNLKISPRRLDYAEPLTWLWLKLGVHE